MTWLVWAGLIQRLEGIELCFVQARAMAFLCQLEHRHGLMAMPSITEMMPPILRKIVRPWDRGPFQARSSTPAALRSASMKTCASCSTCSARARSHLLSRGSTGASGWDQP